ncbi:bifunctional adenosylcobinamide kinase/adenosylcobinamide-phosphate guanylyltransferase [Porphyromonadaceae bacterium W3.11]|nr:bifunctional adenosylcobinamide kinase/adenosylcobinamide-phosphate guanylyltransferase [Porphyromonadaceae bacterium W3.11]
MDDSKIILITGGTRSGKSAFAEGMALQKSTHPVYLATAIVQDEEFRDRVAKHQARRGPEWTNIEEPLNLSQCHYPERVILVDCITLWCTNALFHFEEDIDKTFEYLKNELDRFTEQPSTFIFVTNEVGLGGIASNALMRKFIDLQGWMNQYVASKADEVFMMVSGIGVKIK